MKFKAKKHYTFIELAARWECEIDDLVQAVIDHELVPNLLQKIKAGKLTNSDGALLETFTPRQIYLKNWTGLNKPANVRKAAELLIEFDILRLETVESSTAGGRPSQRYRINPSVLSEISTT